MSIGLDDRIGAVVTKYDQALEGFAGIKDKESIANKIDTDVTLTSTEIQTIHEIMCEKFGGESTIRDKDLFNNLCCQPYQEVFGLVLYPTVYDKAAKFLESFSHHQVFVDGNKRTGFMTMCVLLEKNGIHFNMSQRDAYDFVMDVIQGKYEDISDIANIIKENSIKDSDLGLGNYNDMENINL